MNIIENYKDVVFKNYTNFEGRVSRAVYWHFFLASFIIAFLLGVVEQMLGFGTKTDMITLTDVYAVLVLVPSIAVGVRRIHDGNRSGWWILLPLYNLYLLIIKGTVGENRFGPDPVSSNSSEQPVTEVVPDVAPSTPEDSTTN